MKKRRKLKDNPYTIRHIEKEDIYRISFIENTIKRDLEISKELYDIFNDFELKDKSYMNEYDRHIEHFEISELKLNQKIIHKEISLEDKFIIDSELKQLYLAINKLPKIQKRRIKMFYFEEKTQQEIANLDKCSLRAVQYSLIKMFYFEEKTQQEIANLDKCSLRAVQYSLNYALKNLKKFLIKTS